MRRLVIQHRHNLIEYKGCDLKSLAKSSLRGRLLACGVRLGGSPPLLGFARSSLGHLRMGASTARYFWLQIMCELKSDITISKWETLRCETIANQTINTVRLL